MCPTPETSARTAGGKRLDLVLWKRRLRRLTSRKRTWISTIVRPPTGVPKLVGGAEENGLGKWVFYVHIARLHFWVHLYSVSVLSEVV